MTESTIDNLVIRQRDKDRLIQAGLDLLELESRDAASAFPTLQQNGTRLDLTYIAGAADIRLDRFASWQDRAGYVAQLLREIRAGLDPIIT